ncbi:UNVERIFIED_CONTAM: enamine deaminase RidA (YjgF/YER057c/UK114 family) [Acetivibrio alkalicellulosi]
MYKNYFFSIPPIELSFEEQLNNCTNEIKKLTNFDRYKILYISFFTDAYSAGDFLQHKKLISNNIINCFDIMIPYSIIAQSPVSSKIAAEVCYVDLESSHDLKVEYKCFDNFNYCVIRIGDVKEVISSGITFFEENLSLYDQIFKSFNTIEEILQREEMTFWNVVRQWNYVEEITAQKISKGKMIQNYQLLNDIREHTYRKYNFTNGYPSATGIGMKTGGAVIAFIASSLGDGVTPIMNSEQIDAHKYSKKVLVGDAIEGMVDKATPKFERAKLVEANGTKEIYVSGTAAIKGEKTLGIGDVAEQTLITIDNINKLLSVDNLKKQEIFIEGLQLEYTYLRIYAKDKSSVEIIEQIIKENYKDVKTLIVVGDICRNNLLVEIEGICYLK